MSRIPITHSRFLNDSFDRLLSDQLHLFDPWRDLENLSLNRNSIRWLKQPHQLNRSTASVSNIFDNDKSTVPINNVSPNSSEKFRVQLNVEGFPSESIKTRVDGRKLIVEAKQEERNGSDFNLREIRRSFDLPEHADADNLASFLTQDNVLVVEFPIHRPQTQRRLSQIHRDRNDLALFGQNRDSIFDYNAFLASSDFQPKIIDSQNGSKILKLFLSLKNYGPEQIKVSVKNNELIVQAESFHNNNNRSERSMITKSLRLPPGTQLEQIRSYLNPDGQLEIEAPFVEPNQSRQIEIQRQ